MSEPGSSGPVLGGRLRSFRYALRGVALLLRSQPNAKIHFAVAVAALAVGAALGLSVSEWCAVVLAITGVFVAEAVNTALELLADAALPELHPLVEQSKDVAAGAVLISSVGAVAVGVIVFAHRIGALLR